MDDSFLKGAGEYLGLAAGIVLVIDENQSVQFINRKGCLLLEASKEDVVGKNWYNHFVPEERREDARKLFQKLMATGEPLDKEYDAAIRTKKDNTRFVRWRHTVLNKDEAPGRAILSLGEDITDKTILLQRLSMQEERKRHQLISAVLDAQEKERYEISFELHDNVNQILTTCKLLLEQEAHNGNKSVLISNTTKYIQNAIDEIRNISHQLNPAYLEDVSFDQAVHEMANKINLTARLKVKVSIEGKNFLNMLPSSLTLSIFRILQEQLSNIMKYAKASQVEIILHADEESVDFEVKDNGKGFDLKRATKGLGLKSIYSRAELHNGTVYINTAPGEGCMLSVHIPY
jgi:PAS domain S-box-containing protein